MKLKVRILYDARYKDFDSFETALERWESKGWTIADVANSLSENRNAAIIYKVISPTKEGG